MPTATQTHTPGPWTLREGYPDEICSADPDHATMFGNIAVAFHPYSERLANARLIATAPKLLAALREIYEGACEDKGFYQSTTAAKARAAIEEATQ